MTPTPVSLLKMMLFPTFGLPARAISRFPPLLCRPDHVQHLPDVPGDRDLGPLEVDDYRSPHRDLLLERDLGTGDEPHREYPAELVPVLGGEVGHDGALPLLQLHEGDRLLLALVACDRPGAFRDPLPVRTFRGMVQYPAKLLLRLVRERVLHLARLLVS